MVHELWGIEVKSLSRPTYGDITGACMQAERNALEGQIPVGVIHKVGSPMDDALVVFRVKTFREWFLT